jgi:hypothetical protein
MSVTTSSGVSYGDYKDQINLQDSRTNEVKEDSDRGIGDEIGK